MLPTFVIGLREGLEAALIVGIIAAFLRQQGRKDLLRWVFVGVATAVAICVGIGVTLNVISQDLPQKQQEGMETVIGAIAVVMVTYMVVWMRRHARDLRGQLEGMAADAVGASSGGSGRAARAMVLMAFLAVLREGIETVVFLLAIFNTSRTGADGPVGAVLGIVLALALGYGIYRGGVRLNLAKFFRFTGLVLVLVAAGLVVNALHTAHEAGWLNSGQGSTVDLTWLVQPGSVQSSLLTGMLGVQPHPVVIESIGWLLYLIPVGLYVAWPPGKALARRTTSRVLLAAGAVFAITAVVLLAVMPSQPGAAPTTLAAGGATVSTAHGQVTVVDAGHTVALTKTGDVVSHGVALDTWTANTSVDDPTLHSTTFDRIAALNGGRLPIGAQTTGATNGVLRYTNVSDIQVLVEPRTSRLVSVNVVTKQVAALVSNGRVLPLSDPVSSSTLISAPSSVVAATAAAHRDLDALNHRSTLTGFAWFAGVLALLCLLAGGALAARPGRVRTPAVDPVTPQGTLVRS